MKSKLYPECVKWDDWKDLPVPDALWEEYDAEYYGDVKDGLNVEFYKSESKRHSKEFLEEFLYEYQSVLAREEFQYEDFPQTLICGPDYMAWIEWIELECQAGKRFPYEAYLQFVKTRRKLQQQIEQLRESFLESMKQQ